MSDDRPSIAELQRAYALYLDRRNMQAAARIIDAAPALLELAAAALALLALLAQENLGIEGGPCPDIYQCRDIYAAALAKVRS